MFGQLGDAGSANPIDACVQNLAQLREEGFRRVWMSQMPYEPDLLTILAVALREVDDIEVASGVVPIQNQHPMQMAQRALTVSLASGGRFILGLGMTHQAVTEGMWGIPWDKPVRRLNEYLDGLLPLLAGEPAAATGETRHHAGRADDRRRAAARRVRRGAGSAAAEDRRPPHGGHVHVDDGTQDAGRSRQSRRCGRPPPTRAAPTMRCGWWRRLPVSVTDDVDGARKQAAEQFAMYGVLPSYRAMLDREGYAGPEDAAIIGDETTVQGPPRRTAGGGRRRVRRRHVRRVARGPGPHPRGAARAGRD